ncbi:hypothetical protein EYR40_009919 [Pleurotus pulmonarius]|nr:hypothetical protein EYR40_009919 [Pleurotus pulmonarius]
MRPGTSRFMATVVTMWKANRSITDDKNLSFKPEAQGLPAENSNGQVQFELGERIGYDQRYTITRMLDLGGHSSAWLAWNQILDKYVAVKVLDARSTNLHERRLLWEEEALKRLTFPSTTVHPKNINYFAHR